MTIEKITRVSGVDVISTTEISRKLGFTVSINLLKSAGLSPEHVSDRGAYWRADSFPVICEALKMHLTKLATEEKKIKRGAK